MTGQEIVEYEALHELFRSEGWKFVRNLLAKRRQALEEEMKQSLRKQEDRKAGEKLARADEVSIMFTLVKNRYKELENNKE